MEEFTSLTNEDLVNEWINGNFDAVTELYNRHEKTLYRQIYKITFNREDTEDLLNETWSKAYEKIETFKKTGSFSAWICRIAYNISINHYRRKKRQTEKERNMIFSLEKYSSDKKNVSDEFCHLKECLKHLSSRDANIILLRYGLTIEFLQVSEPNFYTENHTLEEIAQIFGLSVEGVRRIIIKAIEDLQKCMEKKNGS